jgi:hypothetical protein
MRKLLIFTVLLLTAAGCSGKVEPDVYISDKEHKDFLKRGKVVRIIVENLDEPRYIVKLEDGVIRGYCHKQVTILSEKKRKE